MNDLFDGVNRSPPGRRSGSTTQTQEEKKMAPPVVPGRLKGLVTENSGHLEFWVKAIRFAH